MCCNTPLRTGHLRYTALVLPSLHSPAPDFVLLDQDEEERSLSDLKGRWVLLYFYPKDDTPGCTTEACGMRDAIKKFAAKNCAVWGISTDSVKSHKKFEKKYKLSFPLLADEEKKVVQAYGVWQEKSFMGKKYMGIVRTSFLIDPEGKIAKIYPTVTPEEHAKEVLADLTQNPHG